MNRAKWREMVDRGHGPWRWCSNAPSLLPGYGALSGGPVLDTGAGPVVSGDSLLWVTPASRRMKARRERQGKTVSRKRVQRLRWVVGIRAIYRRSKTRQPEPGRRPYHICWVRPRSPGPTRYGPPTSRMFPWPGDSSTWRPSWTGIAVTSRPGGSPTPPDRGRGQVLEADFCVDALDEGPGGVQHRSRKPVHQPGVHPGPDVPRSEDQHGCQGEVPRQHHGGAFVADGEV